MSFSSSYMTRSCGCRTTPRIVPPRTFLCNLISTMSEMAYPAFVCLSTVHITTTPTKGPLMNGSALNCRIVAFGLVRIGYDQSFADQVQEHPDVFGVGP